MKSCGGTYERIICSCICCKNTISANNLIQHFRSKQCLSGFKASLRPASVNIPNNFVCFCIDNIIIEIDGEKWHPLGNEKDAKRDLQLSNIGYVVYRIRSKENIQNRLQQILSR